jgi:hypothetical protein
MLPDLVILIISSSLETYPVRYMIYLNFGVSGMAERAGVTSSRVVTHLKHDVTIISNAQNLGLLDLESWW